MEAVFHWPLRVYYEDTDTGGVVFYANYLKFFERARTEWLRAAGVGQQSLAVSDKVMFVVKSTAIDYHLPGLLDDQISVSVVVKKLGRASVEFDQQAWRIGGVEPQLLCSGSIRVGCVDTQSLRPVGIPAHVLARLGQSHVLANDLHQNL